MRNHNLEVDFHPLLTATAWRSVSAKCQIETSLPWKSNSGIWFPQTVRKPFLHNHKKKLYIFLICEFPRCSMTNNFEIVKWEKWMNIARTRISIINIQFPIRCNRAEGSWSSAREPGEGRPCLAGCKLWILFWFLSVIMSWVIQHAIKRSSVKTERGGSKYVTG